jgi:hypothetical protein
VNAPVHVIEDHDEHGPFARCTRCGKEHRFPVGIIVGRAIDERLQFVEAHSAC